jgi:hypothetical protein
MYRTGLALLVMVVCFGWLTAAARTCHVTVTSTIQACVNAAAAQGPCTCNVPRGISNTSQVEMASNVTLLFQSGTFTNTNTGGGVFIHFGAGVSRATVTGKGVSSTTLASSSGGTQFGAVVQDEGTRNTVSQLTLDAGGNSTSTLVSIKATSPTYSNLKLIHDTSVVSGHNYALDMRGVSNFSISRVETVGGSLGGFSLVTKDDVGSYGNVTSGAVVGFTAHDSPHNGIDWRADGGYSICGTSSSPITLSNINTHNNGTSSSTSSDTKDDQFGWSLTANLDNSGASACYITVSGFSASSNEGSGWRLKGPISHVTATTLNITSNGYGTANDRNALDLITSNYGAPSNNSFGSINTTNTVRRGGARYAVYTDSSASNNSFTNLKGGPYSLNGTRNAWR